MSSQGQGERLYTEEDLVGNKNELIKLVQRQQSKWPEEKFQPSKVTVPKLKSTLLDPTYDFTTNKPRVTSPHPSKSGSRSSVNPGTPKTITINSHETPAPNPVPQGPSPHAVEVG
ncbi:hypothetical protein DFH07DRAFT_771598 [Mycena maculata]|uniref:Uncharacterized protein n=1 Tax=Mycena maculata TaxID=230809 RepID=A0AAD7NHT2_9AGAR|nr:hypothetical protein DFH07DRAFT_771598 [Mycena maculata]